MLLNCILNDVDDIRDEDPTLSYGFFELSDKGISLRMFDDKSCMLFVSLTDLIEYFSAISFREEVDFNWVSAGFGAVLSFKRASKSEIEIRSKEFSIILGREIFLTALVVGAKKFVDFCVMSNPELLHDPNFKYLSKLVDALAEKCNWN